MKIRILIFSLIILIWQMYAGALSDWEALSVALFVFFFLEFLNDLGKKIVILQMTSLIAILTWLILPVIFYHVYTKEDYLARLWFRFMPVSSDSYFSFVVPGTLTMILGFRIPLMKLKFRKTPETYLVAVKDYLKDKPNLGLILIGVGLASRVIDFVAPESLKQVFYLLEHLTYVGVFYVFYSPSKIKRIVFISVFIAALMQAILATMFGEFISIMALSIVLIMLGRKVSFNRKLVLAVVGLCVIVVIQSVKSQYRTEAKREGQGSAGLFGDLIVDRLSDPSYLLDKDKLFFVAVRMNQGWLVAMTMYNVPDKHSFANGETIWQSVAAAIVPRLLWPDKPEAGGKANLKRFWGYNIEGYSMNIGPIGEAYANFDRTGGIIYMFFYGLFFNIMLVAILKLAERRPSLILWLPLLFLYALSVETDLLITMSSLIKASMFAWIIFWVFRKFFNITL